MMSSPKTVQGLHPGQQLEKASDRTLQENSADSNNDGKKEDQDDYPLGRYRAWSTVVGSFLLTFAAGGSPAAFGVFQDYYTNEWLNNYSPSEISWIGGAQLFLELGVAPVAGKFYDAGYFRHVVMAGSLLISFSYFMLSLSQENKYYQVFLSQGIGMGLGIGLLYLPAAAVVSHHFKKRRVFAMGVVSSSAPAGGIIYSIMLNKLILGSTGFAWGVRYAAFVTSGCLLLGNLLVFDTRRSRGPVTTRRKDDVDREASASPTTWDYPFLSVLFCAFLLNFGTYFPSFYVQLYATSHGITASLAFYSIAILNAANVFGRLLPNYMADRIGAMSSFIACLAMSGAATLMMFACRRPAGLIAFTILYGFSLGGTISLYLPMISSLCTERRTIGRRMGISLLPVGVACLIGEPITGAILGPELKWWRGIVFASATMLGACICLIGVVVVVLRPSCKTSNKEDTIEI